MKLLDAAESALEQFLGDPECKVAVALARAIEFAKAKGEDVARTELANAISAAVHQLEPGQAKDELIDQLLAMGEKIDDTNAQKGRG